MKIGLAEVTVKVVYVSEKRGLTTPYYCGLCCLRMSVADLCSLWSTPLAERETMVFCQCFF